MTVVLLLLTLAADPPKKLTLREAEEIAAKNHPRVSVALMNSLASGKVSLEIRSNNYPNITGAFSSAGALENSRIAAGGITNPAIFSRVSSGLAVSQLVTDFGRTKSLAEAADLRAKADQEAVKAARAEVVLQVDFAYFLALKAQALMRVASEAIKAREAASEKAAALEQAKLKSGLDASFARVQVSEAKLALLRAENGMRAAFADLSSAMGSNADETYELTEESLPAELGPDVADFVKEAVRNRPELAQLKNEGDAADHIVQAEKDLKRPTIVAVAMAGVSPAHASQITNRWAVAGVNVNVPIFNGRLFEARQAEAEFRASAVRQRAREVENRITRDVRVAYLTATNSIEQVAVTEQLAAQANLALDLARSRYDLGLSSIVELTQAQLNQTSAEIANAGARYEYLLQRSVLRYQTGAIR